MSTYLIVDSCCDLPLEYIEKHDDVLDVIGMPVNIEGFEYYDDLGKTFTHDELYEKLRQGIMPSTAQINSYRFAEMFEKHLENHETIVYIGFSSGMSGTLESAIQSVEIVKEKNPNADIRIIDTLSASIGLGILTMKAVDMIRNGRSADELITWFEKNKMNTNHWFAVDDLNYLKNGGRISSAEATIGTLLSVKPIVIVNHDGMLKPYTKVKGRKKSMRFLINKFKEHYKENEYNKILIGHGNTLEDALKVKELLSEHVSTDQIIITELSATIASHVGPGMLAISFIGNEREHK